MRCGQYAICGSADGDEWRGRLKEAVRTLLLAFMDMLAMIGVFALAWLSLVLWA